MSLRAVVYRDTGQINMTRAAWDNTMNVKYGPSSVSGVPGTLYRTDVPCRVVLQSRITQTEYPNDLTLAWITYEDPLLNFATIRQRYGSVYDLDYGAADRVSVASSPLEELTVLRSEYVVPYMASPYCRTLVCFSSDFPPNPVPGPPPQIAPPGGVGCAGAVLLTFGERYTYTCPTTPTDAWWYVVHPLNARIKYVFTRSTATLFTQFYRGNTCGDISLDYVPPGGSLSGCYADGWPVVRRWIRVANSGAPGQSITFGVLPGYC